MFSKSLTGLLRLSTYFNIVLYLALFIDLYQFDIPEDRFDDIYKCRSFVSEYIA